MHRIRTADLRVEIPVPAWCQTQLLNKRGEWAPRSSFDRRCSARSGGRGGGGGLRRSRVCSGKERVKEINKLEGRRVAQRTTTVKADIKSCYWPIQILNSFITENDPKYEKNIKCVCSRFENPFEHPGHIPEFIQSWLNKTCNYEQGPIFYVHFFLSFMT